MKWDKKQLLFYLLESKHPEKLLDFLEVIKGLLLKYGRKLVIPRFLETLRVLQPDVWLLIHVLEKEKMLNVAKLSAFIREFQSLLPKEHAQFTLESNDEDIIAPLMAYLEEKFGQVKVNFQPLASENLSVKMKGQGYVFKRSLERDLDVLLK